MCLPVTVRNWFAPTPEKLIIEVQHAELLVRHEKGKSSREIGRYPIQALRDGSLKGQLPKIKEKQIVVCSLGDACVTEGEDTTIGFSFIFLSS